MRLFLEIIKDSSFPWSLGPHAFSVAAGYVGGGLPTHKGAGTNSLCLPETPEYDDDLTSGGNNRLSLLYSPLSDVHEGDIMCAVCLARGRSTTLMIPAKRTCPSGWTKEYGGLLMGSYKEYSGHNYLCIGRNPQARHGSMADNEGQLFYPTSGVCSSLPCPPYVNGYEISCVVCTK
ncbi:uncharacterized protein LOC117112266 [Anneissia japonica]|uniref:uncharacterized protein LOC117112266 n=1 Tax=Anneissia japonica TaxID=1529436 RepID=UPI00142561B2|nr:uncharacterized protein LOC117112266 [Anneissia japonica]